MRKGKKKNYVLSHEKREKPKPNQYQLMDGRDLDLSTGRRGKKMLN